ncbi:RagB/SusD family nutrient uptake outer membrane protein [Natronoflexus pectinivorans]|uniref:Putative outer membrane starch-binding protein n=1 Tax=Natronoflexus pectinivorans TaxID=682526 RepID=A0A4V2RWY9_9BACT|nr:RagB/SusD family nutrient uptake outer membrane protein [Natronoflexus pectinivorans]TCO10801.1 putative outer membrane starch-binding protein [Natronoflexus pectinivorans]
MKKYFKHTVWAMVGMLLLTTSCEDFLDRPTEDAYTIDNFFQTNEQCFQAANILYNSPWYDFQRGFLWIGDMLAGNIYQGTDNIYQNFNLSSSNEDLINASNSLWLVNGHANAIIENIATRAGSNVSEEVKNTVTGEAMTMKALAYFYLVRIWGEVPIIHSNSQILGDGTANTLPKNRLEDVYEYIERTLLRAIELLPEQNTTGRINKYSAKGLLAKVYLTRSGVNQSGSRDQQYLDLARDYAKMVIDGYPGQLEPEYSNLFRISTGNYNPENLISWRWTISNTWTSQNSIQSDVALNNFTGLADTWGSWRGVTLDLINLFGDNPLSSERQNEDRRRKATIMMWGDHYPYFWRHEGGFTATMDDDDNVAGAVFGVPTGGYIVKHIVGHIEGDHYDENGRVGARMATDLATHILRLADIYLIYAEAILGNNESTNDPEALEYFNRVRLRANPNANPSTSISFMDIFNERRKEFATEGDNWYDYVRLSYYNPQLAVQLINAQERGNFDGLYSFYRGESSQGDVTLNSFKVTISSSSFKLPFPDIDLAMNPNLTGEPVPFDFSSIPY